MSINNIDNIFRKSFEDDKQVVPDAVWGRIDNKIKGNATKSRVTKYSIAASIVILLCVGGFVFNNNPTQQNIANQSTTDTITSQVVSGEILEAPTYADSMHYNVQPTQTNVPNIP